MSQNLTANGRAQIVFLTDPTDAEIGGIIALYKEAGWWAPGTDNEELVRLLVAGSHCFAAAFSGGRMVGMGRAVSDRVSDAYIQDVTVTAAERGRGLASEIVSALVDRLKGDGVGWIALVAERGTSRFYTRLGFSPMPESVAMKLGSG